MEFGNLLIVVLLMYYTFYFVGLTSKNKREIIQKTNVQLDVLRKKPVKTLDEQKTFISLKYPKKDKYKFRWLDVGKILLYLLVGVTVMIGYSKLFTLLGIHVPLFIAIIIIMVIPIIINYFLGKLHLEKDDVLLYIIGKKR